MNIDNSYKLSITEVNKIISMLSPNDLAKIPTNVRMFFESNSDRELMKIIKINPILSEQKLSENTKKLLKVVDCYLKKK